MTDISTIPYSNQITDKAIERDVMIRNTHIHIKSVFYEKIPLEKALENIVTKKLRRLKS